MAIPNVTVTTDKAQYLQGDPITVTFTVAADTYDKPTSRTIEWAGSDDEGNRVTGTTVISTLVPTADGFTIESVRWADTGQALTVNGLTATGTA